MKLTVYYSDPVQNQQQLLQVFELRNGIAVPIMHDGDNDWDNVSGFTPDDGEKYLKALQEKLSHSTYLHGVLS